MANTTYGAIKLQTAENVGSVLKKKMGTQTGYKPKEWAETINLLGKLPTRTATGAIAHFEDGADDVPCVSVVANILPVQDLHGYANPWIGGTGKNLAQFFNDGKVPSISNGALVDYYGNRTDFIKVYPSTNYTLSAVSLSGTCYFFFYDENKDFISYQQDSIPMTRTTPSNCKYVMLRNDTALSSYEDVQFETGSTATSYEPYENICPISGNTECEVMQTGANLFNPNAEIVPHSTYGFFNLCPDNVELSIQLFDKDDTVSLSGISFGFSKRLTEDGAQSEVSTGFKWIVSNGNDTGLRTNAYSTSFCDQFFFYPKTQATLDTINARYYINIVVGSTVPTTYEAYQGTTYPISWQTEAGTVYGGELNATTGVLRVTHGKIVLDGTQSLNRTNWRSTANSVGWIYPYSLTNNKTATSQQTPNMYADTLPTVRYGLLYDGIVGIGVYTSNELGLVVMHSDTSLTTSTAVNAYLSENPITVVYELATPTEVQLTPQEVRTLLGTNNIYHDCNGDSTIEYRADIDLLISLVELMV